MSERYVPRLVGVVHLPPLPGSPLGALPTRACAEYGKAAAKVLADCGFDAIIVENFGDAPFYSSEVPPITVAAMTACVLAVREAAPGLAVGVNVLRNDAEAALSVAVATEASFVRVNVLTGARVTDQGIIEGNAASLLRLRRALSADSIGIWADVDVKHSAPLGAARPLAQEVEDTTHRALASAILVTGSGTGKGVDLEKLALVRAASGSVPVYVASGSTLEQLPSLAEHATGVIVGSALREGGRAGGPVDPALTQAFASAFRRAFSV